MSATNSLKMPRYSRLVVVDAAHHVTQRGNHREPIFAADDDRQLYLDLLREQCRLADLAVLGYCLMTNHVHLIAAPRHERSLAQALGRAHFRYANYFQAKRRTNGHLWQNRFYSCPLSESHLTKAMLYIERNPVRANLTSTALEWPWSSARVHAGGLDRTGLLDSDAWSRRFTPEEWSALLRQEDPREEVLRLERCTFAGKPYGEPGFVQHLAQVSGRVLDLQLRGRPKKLRQATAV